MRVLVVSEGKHELGDSAETSALVAIVNRILPGANQFVIDKVSNPRVKIHTPRGKARDYEKRCVAWLKQAQEEGYDALVLVVDRDGHAERLSGIQSAQENTLCMLQRALGVAIESFDAWLLADQHALSKVLHKRIDTQPDPEQMRQAKSHLQQLCADTGREANREFYFQVAQVVDLEQLRRRCPLGFEPFHERVASLAAS